MLYILDYPLGNHEIINSPTSEQINGGILRIVKRNSIRNYIRHVLQDLIKEFELKASKSASYE